MRPRVARIWMRWMIWQGWRVVRGELGSWFDVGLPDAGPLVGHFAWFDFSSLPFLADVFLGVLGIVVPYLRGVVGVAVAAPTWFPAMSMYPRLCATVRVWSCFPIPFIRATDSPWCSSAIRRDRFLPM